MYEYLEGGIMSKWPNSYSEEDITDVYSAILSTRPCDVARSLFREWGANPKSGSAFIEKRLRISASRIKSIFNLMRSLQPNFECSVQKPLKPWVPSNLVGIHGKSWPDVLGMRIVIPHDASKKQKAHMISNLLTNMTSIR